MARGTGAEEILYGEHTRRSSRPSAIGEPGKGPKRVHLGIRQAAVLQRLQEQTRAYGGCIFPAVKKYAEQPQQIKEILASLQSRGYVDGHKLSAGSEVCKWKITTQGEAALEASKYAQQNLLI